MSTIKSNQFAINGVIDTNKPVMQNITTLATAAGSWVTFDVNQGKWAVVINQAGTSIKSFNDSNIIGNITISGTGIRELYNTVQVDFPHKDLMDQKDTVIFSIDPSNRFSNEQDNILNFQLDCVNDPVQIELLAARELKQSRIDKVIQFRTDFTSLGLKAGDLIDVTSEMLDFTNKVFRILSISEEDGDDNVLALSISAFEYDSSIYTTLGLTREERTLTNDIVAKSCNSNTQASDNEAGLPMDLSNIAKALGLTLLFNNLTGRWELTQGGKQVSINGDSAVISWTFQDGIDLDIRCRMYYPNMGQNSIDQYLGYTGASSLVGWPATPPYALSWGGDNTGAGTEAVAVNISYLKSLFPGEQYFIVECRGNWFIYDDPDGGVDENGVGIPDYTTRGISPVLLSAILYQGGTLNPSGFNFSATGYTDAKKVDGLEVYVNSAYGQIAINGQDGSNTLGDLMGYFIFDAVNNTAQFRNDLTGL
jgi:hypothetical protein